MKRVSLFALLSFCLISLLFPATFHGADSEDYVTITTASPKLYTHDSTGSPPVRTDENLFGKSFEIMNESGQFYQIQITGGDSAFIEKKRFQFLKNLRNSGYIMARRMPDSKLIKKALIVNRPQSGNIESDIGYYDNPGLSGRPRGKISIFEVRFIFAESKKAMLVGRTDRMLRDNSESVLTGWIDKNHVISWNTLIGVEFGKDNYRDRAGCEIGKIFSSERKLARKAPPMFTEGKTPEPMPYYANRFPTLKKLDNGARYKIAYIGNAFGEGGKVYSATEVDAEKNKVMKVIQNENVQIAILIDGTKGMENHIAAVKTALKNFLGEYQGRDGMTANIAIAVYRDYPVGDRVFEKMTGFTKDLNTLRKAVNNVRIITSHGDDSGPGKYPEAVFLGISRTMNELRWKSRKKGEKYILLIGDHGNHEQYDQYPQDRKFSAEGIGQTLRKKAITLYALQVNITEKWQKYNRMFQRQVRVIKQNNQGRGRLNKVPSRSASAISESLGDLVKDFLIIREELKEIRSSGGIRRKTVPRTAKSADSAGGMTDMYKGVFSQKMLERYGINPDVFRAVQICDIGYVNEKNRCGHKQLYEKVLIKKNDIEALKVQMQQLSDAIRFYDPSTEEEFVKTVIKVVKALTRDKIGPDENIAEFIHKKIGIPVHSPFLRKSLNDLQDDIRNPSRRKLYRKYLQERIVFLEQVTKERVLSFKLPEDWDPEDQVINYRDTGKPILYFFSLEQPLPKRGKVQLRASQKQYAWIPHEYLP